MSELAPPERRGAARFNRIDLARSPITNAAQRSTPQPVRRTLFARLFRLKHHDEETARSVSAAASPSSHQSTPTHDDRGLTTTASSHAMLEHSSSERLPVPAFARAVTMPYHNHHHHQDLTKTSNEVIAATPPPLGKDDGPKTRILLEGSLVKLSSHKYWHARATFFVLEEVTTEPRSRMVLKQYRTKKTDDVVLMEIELSSDDVVTDISDRYIKHGLELWHRLPPRTAHERYGVMGVDDAVVPADGELYSLRLSVDDASLHRKWMRVLGSAIARLIDQKKRHYPNLPADVEFARGTLKAFEPGAVTAIVGTAIPVKGPAKVLPMVTSSSSSSSSDEEEAEVVVDENQSGLNLGDNDRQDEMRSPEEPETHSDADDDPQPSFESDCASPHHDNNNLDDFDEYYHERSSNQLEDHDDDDEQQTRDLAAVESSLTQASPVGTASVESSPSPEPPRSTAHDDDALVTNVAAAMAAASVAVDDGVLATPPTSPPTLANKLFPPVSRHSRVGSMLRPQVHSFNANGQVFTLDVRYRLLKSIGNGAYGAVIAASDSVADSSVAVKKITNIFDDLVDAKRILREVRLLRHFHHKNITQLLDLAPPMTKKSFEDMYIITELMETDLHQVIYSMQPMSDDHVKYFLYQMLCALYHIHSAGVLHRDMKPSNILLNSNCDLKVCDFGLARGGMDPRSDSRRLAQPNELTEYVVTRWYRAPEIMLNCLQYTAAVDVWAIGCIFAEMLLREPLFPGNDYMHQLKLIIKFLGTPKQDDISFIKNVKALRFLTKLSISKPKKWREVFTGDDVNPLALDLLAQMLIFNPDKRISVEQALQHPYLSTFYDAADITRAPPFSFDFDLPDDKLSKEALVDLLCEDVACFHPALMQALMQPPAPAHPTPMVPRPSMSATANGGNRYFGTTASAS